MVIDTGIFIEHLRSKNKLETTLYRLPQIPLFISSVTVYELYTGATGAEKELDLQFTLKGLIVLPFSDVIAVKAAQIYRQLKHDNNIIEFRDIFIAATAIINELPLLTLNKKHFNRVTDLTLYR